MNGLNSGLTVWNEERRAEYDIGAAAAAAARRRRRRGGEEFAAAKSDLPQREVLGANMAPRRVGDLSADELTLVLVRLENADDIARASSVSKGFGVAAGRAAKERAKSVGVALPLPRDGEPLLRQVRWAEAVARRPPTTLAATSAGSSLALHEQQLYSWGGHVDEDGFMAHLGLGELDPTRMHVWRPQLVGGPFCALSSSYEHVLALDLDDGAPSTVWVFGEGDFGRLGTGREETLVRPTRLAPLGIRILQVAAGGAHSLLLTAAGEVLAFGNNEYGQLGLGDQGDGTERLQPTALRTQPSALAEFAGRRVVALSAGGECSAAVDEAGALWSWGYNAGQLGHGDEIAKLRPMRVEALADRRVRSVDTGGRHTLIVTAAGELYARAA